MIVDLQFIPMFMGGYRCLFRVPLMGVSKVNKNEDRDKDMDSDGDASSDEE